MERTINNIINILLKNPISLIFLAMIIIGIILLILSIFQKKIPSKEIEKKQEIPKIKTLKDIDTIDEEKETIFNLYKEVEIAKMKFKFNILEEKLEKNLYQKHELELKELKKNHQKIVSTDITLEEIKILSKTKKKFIETLEVFLHVSQYDYVIDKEKKIIRGTDEDRYQIEYKMTINKNLEINKYTISKKECVGKWIKK